jgi:hypothetical protein
MATSVERGKRDQRDQRGAQARETLAFADRLRAAAHLLADWLRWRQAW